MSTATRSRKRRASTNGLHEFITGLTPENLNCRMVGHAWPLLKDQHLSVDEFRPWLYIDMACDTCSSERHDVVHTTTGRLVRRRYKYAYGYLKPKGLKGRVLIANVRADFVERLG